MKNDRNSSVAPYLIGTWLVLLGIAAFITVLVELKKI